MGDLLKLKRGLKENLPTLAVGEPAFVTDEKDIYIGTVDGNISISNVAIVNNLKKELNDYMANNIYQTPTIIDTQIQLIKNLNIDRLFFKLDTDLSGPITISTDNGLTNKILTDINGVQLLSLSKGLIEIVIYKNCFIIRDNNSSINNNENNVTEPSPEIDNQTETNSPDLIDKLNVQKTNLTNHMSNSLPHNFVDTDLKTYKYGFKLNDSKDGLIFVYEEVL